MSALYNIWYHMGAEESTTVKDELVKYEDYHQTICNRLSRLEEKDQSKKDWISYLKGRNEELEEQLSEHDNLIARMRIDIGTLFSMHTELAKEVNKNKLARHQQFTSFQQKLCGDITSLNKQIKVLESKQKKLSKDLEKAEQSKEQTFFSLQQKFWDDIASLNMQIKVLESKQTKLSKDLEKAEQSKEQTFFSLQQKLGDDIASLNSQCHAMKESCDKADSLTTLQHMLNKLHFRATERHMLTQEIDTLKRDMKSLKENMKDVGCDNRVAFSAGKWFDSPVLLREQMVWTKMSECNSVAVSNPSFSQADVIFTAPAHGTYAFYAELEQTGSGELMVAMEGISGIKYFFGKTSGSSPQCCGLAVLKLKPKERVWIVVLLMNGTAQIKGYWFSGWRMG